MSFRRVNKSKKVPNVKLRPAAPGARKDLRTPDSTWTHSSGLDSDNETSEDKCPRPFRSFVLCATGISDKTSLFKLAIELGAQSTSDLTDRVTHLIAEDPGSAKYRCALETRIPIMHPSWIVESHKIWLRGDDVNVERSIKDHRLPPFSGVVVCLSGIEDVNRRMEINREVTKAGGTYIREMVRPVKATHLLCGNTTEGESDKISYARKFNTVGEAQIHIVWEDWFWDSLRFGGRFDEEPYKVTNPRPPPRALPDLVPPLPSSTAPDQSGLSSEILNAEISIAGYAKAAVPANEEEEEIASVKRVPAVTLHLWESILKPRGFEVQDGRLIRSPSKSQSAPHPPQRREVSPSPAGASKSLSRRGTLKVGDVEGEERPGPKSALSSFRRAQSFVPAPNDVSTPVGGARQPFRRASTASRTMSFLQRSIGSVKAAGGISSDMPITSTSPVAGPSREASAAPDEGLPNATEVSEAGRTMFRGLRFRALGEARSASVKGAIEQCGGKWVGIDDDDNVHIIVVRLISGSNIFRQEVDEEERVKYRTECWLERCIFEERVCAPEENIAFTPLKVALPIPGAEDILLSYSGLDNADACCVRRLLRALGISLAPNFSRRSTHLLCPSGTGAKANKAREWGTPIVDMAWLATIANTGKVPSLSCPSPVEEDNVLDLQLEPHSCDPVEWFASQPPASAQKVDVKDKGKGKEKAIEATMVDITSAENPSPRSQSLSYYDPPADEARPGQAEQLEVEAFGMPNMLLDNPVQPAPPQTPHRSAHGTALPPEPDRSANPGADQGLATQPSADAQGDDRISIPTRLYEDRVPSSESPSPMRMPGAETPRDGSAAPSTPVKITKQATRVIQRHLSSLLGKRPAEDEEEPAPRKLQAHDSRLGKRSKPLQRTKSNMSYTSELLTPRTGKGTPEHSPATAFAAASPVPPAEPELVPHTAGSASKPKPRLTASGDEADNSFVDAEGDEAMRVAYADPKLNTELDRLKYLFHPELEGQGQKDTDMDAEMTLPQLPDIVRQVESRSGSGKKMGGSRGGSRGKRGRGRKGARA